MTDHAIAPQPTHGPPPRAIQPSAVLSTMSIRELVAELAGLEAQQLHAGQASRRLVRDQALVVRELRRRRARLRAQLTQPPTARRVKRSG